MNQCEINLMKCSNLLFFNKIDIKLIHKIQGLNGFSPNLALKALASAISSSSGVISVCLFELFSFFDFLSFLSRLGERERLLSRRSLDLSLSRDLLLSRLSLDLDLLDLL